MPDQTFVNLIQRKPCSLTAQVEMVVILGPAQLFEHVFQLLGFPQELYTSKYVLYIGEAFSMKTNTLFRVHTETDDIHARDTTTVYRGTHLRRKTYV